MAQVTRFKAASSLAALTRGLLAVGVGGGCNGLCLIDGQSWNGTLMGTCVDQDPVPHSACAVCSPQHPCLFDVSPPLQLVRRGRPFLPRSTPATQVKADPSERINIAAEHSELVEKMSTQLGGYEPYVDGAMTPEELSGYECTDDPTEWWANFNGPFCRKKPPSSEVTSK